MIVCNAGVCREICANLDLISAISFSHVCRLTYWTIPDIMEGRMCTMMCVPWCKLAESGHFHTVGKFLNNKCLGYFLQPEIIKLENPVYFRDKWRILELDFSFRSTIVKELNLYPHIRKVTIRDMRAVGRVNITIHGTVVIKNSNLWNNVNLTAPTTSTWRGHIDVILINCTTTNLAFLASCRNATLIKTRFSADALIRVLKSNPSCPELVDVVSMILHSPSEQGKLVHGNDPIHDRITITSLSDKFSKMIKKARQVVPYPHCNFKEICKTCDSLVASRKHCTACAKYFLRAKCYICLSTECAESCRTCSVVTCTRHKTLCRCRVCSNHITTRVMHCDNCGVKVCPECAISKCLFMCFMDRFGFPKNTISCGKPKCVKALCAKYKDRVSYDFVETVTKNRLELESKT